MDRKKFLSAIVVLWGLVTVLGAYTQNITDFKIYLPGLAMVFLGSWLYFNPDDKLWNNATDQLS